MNNRPFLTKIRYHITLFFMRYFVSVYELKRLTRLVQWCSIREFSIVEKMILDMYDQLNEERAEDVERYARELAEKTRKGLPRKG